MAIVGAIDKLMIGATKYFDFLNQLWKDLEPFAEFVFYVAVTFLLVKVIFGI